MQDLEETLKVREMQLEETQKMLEGQLDEAKVQLEAAVVALNRYALLMCPRALLALAIILCTYDAQMEW